MPEIMRQYGPTMIVAVAGVLLVALLFGAWTGGGSVLDDIGARSSSQLAERPGTGAGTAAFDAQSERSLPTATLAGGATQNQELLLLDLFTIADSDGAVWSAADRAFVRDGALVGGTVLVESITSRDGTEHVSGLTGTSSTPMLELNQDTGVATFKEAGVYRVRLKVLDHDNVEASYTIPIVADFALQNGRGDV